MRPIAVALAVVLSMSGCALTKQAQVDLAQEAQIIRQLTNDFIAAETRRDMEASMGFLAPDAIIQPAGAPTINTPEGMRALYKEFFALPYTDIVMEPRTVVVAPSGDMAYVVGPWRMVTASKAGKQEDLGKSTIIWKKTNGEWKAVVMTFSGDAAPAPPSGK